jgi:hypothetical protein
LFTPAGTYVVEVDVHPPLVVSLLWLWCMTATWAGGGEAATGVCETTTGVGAAATGVWAAATGVGVGVAMSTHT